MKKLLVIVLFLYLFSDLHAQVAKFDSTHIQHVIDSLKKEHISEEVSAAFQDLLIASQQLNFKKGEALSIWHLGNYSVETGQFVKAIEQYQKVINIGEALSDTSLLAYGYVSLGIVYSSMANLQKSLDHFKVGNKFAQIKGEENLYYLGLNGLGITNAKMKKYEEAIGCLQKAKAGMIKMKDEKKVQFINYNLANIWLGEDKLQKAIGIVNEYMEKAKAANDSIDICYGHNIMGETYYKLGDYNQALLYYDTSLFYAKALGLIPLISKTYLEQSRIYEDRGELGRALKTYKEHVESKNELFNEETQRQIAQLEVQFETAQKEKEVLEVTQLAKSKQERLWVVIGGLIACLLIGSLFLLKIRSSTKEKTANEKLMLNELQLNELKTKQLQSELENKKADLTNLALDIRRKNEFSSQLNKRLEKLNKQVPGAAKKELRNIINFVTNNLQINEDLAILQKNVGIINQEFYHKLEEQFGDLTPNDKYLAGLMRLNLSNKEVAAIRGISAGSAKVSRHRLRKKMNLDPDTDIVTFLQTM